MGPFKAIAVCYVGMFNFSRRARRAEFWWFTLFQFLAVVGASAAFGYSMAMRAQTDPAFAQMMQNPGVAEAYVNRLIADNLAAIIIGYIVLSWLPSLAVSVRRLHDTNRSGFWYFINFVPLIGAIWFLVLMCLPGTNGPNRFGGDPVKNRKAAEPSHPAFAPQLEGEARDRAEVARKAASHDYYKRRVLPSIQQKA